jgi:hypothetical protein
MYIMNDMILIRERSVLLTDVCSLSILSLRRQSMLEYDSSDQEDNRTLRNIGLDSAFISDNPDFDPSKDVPQSRGCDTTIGIIANT